MEIIEYIVSNGKDLMFLCLGIGFLILTINVSRALIELTSVLKKVNRIVDTVERVLWKPIQVVSQLNNIISKFW